MTEQRKNTLRSVYSVFLAVWTGIVGIAFIVQIYSVYFSAEKYTVQNVSAHFKQIALLFWVWIIAIAGGGVLGFIIPQDKDKPKAYIETSAVLEKLKRRLPNYGDDLALVKKEKTFRLAFNISALLACAIAAVVSVWILLDKSYTPRFTSAFFTNHYCAVDRLLRALPWVLGAALVCILSYTVGKYSYLRETAGVKETLVINAKAGVKTPVQSAKPTVWERIERKCAFTKTKGWYIGVRVAVAAVGVTLVIVGMLNGGMRDVLMKAINICTQCIGLG